MPRSKGFESSSSCSSFTDFVSNFSVSSTGLGWELNFEVYVHVAL